MRLDGCYYRTTTTIANLQHIYSFLNQRPPQHKPPPYSRRDSATMSSTLTTNAPPPHYTSAPALSVPISQALLLLQAYLAASESSPHLHPDCIFTEHGPTFSSAAGAGGLVLHQLRRVEAGLRGERLVAEMEDAGVGEVELPEGDDGRLDQSTATITHNDNEEEEAQDEQGTGDNIDPPTHGETFHLQKTNAKGQKTYQAQMAEQRVGDILDDYGERSNAVGDASHGAKIPTVLATKRGHENEAGGKMDKEARKAAKKLRSKDERRAAGGVRFKESTNVDATEPTTAAVQDEVDMPVSATPGKSWRADGVGAVQANADLDAMDVDVNQPDVETLAAEIGAAKTTADIDLLLAPNGGQKRKVSQAENMLSEQVEDELMEDGGIETKEQRRARKKAKKAKVAEKTGGGFDAGV